MIPLSFASPPYADRAAAGQRLIEPLAHHVDQAAFDAVLQRETGAVVLEEFPELARSIAI